MIFGVDSSKWGKLDTDDEEQLDLLHERKSTDFSGVADDFCPDFCFQRKQPGELHEKKEEVEERKYGLERKRKA